MVTRRGENIFVDGGVNGRGERDGGWGNGGEGT